jgi:hypothetical protein
MAASARRPAPRLDKTERLAIIAWQDIIDPDLDLRVRHGRDPEFHVLGLGQPLQHPRRTQCQRNISRLVKVEKCAVHSALITKWLSAQFSSNYHHFGRNCVEKYRTGSRV